MDEDQLVSIFRAANPQQASIVCSLLENAGIEAANDGDGLQSGAGELPVGWATAPHVRVWKKDEEVARQIIEQFENGEFNQEEDGWQGVDFGDTAYDWPECPKCNELRYAFCPECHFIGIDFESTSLFEIDLGSGEAATTDIASSPDLPVDPGAYVLTCPICAKKSQPSFINECRFCPHKFEEGVQVAHQNQLPEIAGKINLPIIAVGALILGLIVAGVFYFAFVL